MAYYPCKYYGIEASVDAVNRNSAEEQLKWLFKDGNPCFCTECRETYYKDYSVRIQSGYDTQAECQQKKSISNMRLI